MDGTRGDGVTGLMGPSGGPGAVWQATWTGSSSGVDPNIQVDGLRNVFILFIRMSISIFKTQHLKRGPQRSERVISGSQSFIARLSWQNRCSFSRAGSSQEPSVGFWRRKERGHRVSHVTLSSH